MTWILALAVSVGALLLAGWAHLAFWSWRLAAPGREDERLLAQTEDGWTLTLGRRRPRGEPRGPPVLLIHGIAMNRLALDFGVERLSLAAYLAGAGLDCFALDLRGHGASRRGDSGTARVGSAQGVSRTDPRPRRDWTLDDYLALDLPAAMDAVAAASGERQVLLVGHSQGALLALAAAGRYPARVAGVVALAPPIRFTARAAVHLRLLPALAATGLTRLAARMLAPFVGLWHPRAAALSIQPSEMEGPIFRRLMANVIEDLPRGVVAQFEAFIREDRCGSADGREDWRAGLSRSRAPALFVAAPEDGLATPAIVREAHDRWGGEKAWLELPAGIGHTDMLLGRRAPRALFVPVLAWLLARTTPRAPAPGPVRAAAAERP